MDEILAIANRWGLPVIEDCCEAHGAEYRGRKVGSLGTIGCFSFYGNKIITTGEGGMLVTDNAAVAEKARILANHGMSKRKKYWHPRIGFNYRMTNLQAALGVAQMERIDRIIDRKRKKAQLYNSLLEGLPGIIAPPEAPWARSVYWFYTILINDKFQVPRDAIIRELVRRGIEARPVFYPITNMPPYRKGKNQRFPVAEEISKHGISLPSSPALKAGHIRRICKVIRELHQSP
jgi:perosamine synthetase